MGNSFLNASAAENNIQPRIYVETVRDYTVSTYNSVSGHKTYDEYYKDLSYRNGYTYTTKQESIKGLGIYVIGTKTTYIYSTY